MAKLYPHYKKALQAAKVPPNDLDEQLEVLYYGLYNKAQKPNYDTNGEAFKNEYKHLIAKYKQLVQNQEIRNDDHKVHWSQVKLESHPLGLSCAQLEGLLDKLEYNLTAIRYQDFINHTEYFKNMLEKNYLLLAQRCNSHPKEGQQILAEFISDFNVCASGIIGHTATIYNRLNQQNHISYWLAQFRTSLINSAIAQDHAEQRGAKGLAVGHTGPDIHKVNKIFNDFILIGINPLRSHVNDYFGILNRIQLNRCYQYFSQDYNSKDIIDCVASNVQDLIKAFNKRFKHDADGWVNIDITTDDAVEYVDIQQQATRIIEALSISEATKLKLEDILELDEDGTKVRINEKLSGDKLSKFIETYLVKIGLLTANEKDGISAGLLIAHSQNRTSIHTGAKEEPVKVGKLPLAGAPKLAVPGVGAPPIPHVVPALGGGGIDHSRQKFKTDLVRYFILTFATILDLTYYFCRLLKPALLKTDPLYQFAVRYFPFSSMFLPLAVSLGFKMLVRRYGERYYDKQNVVAGKTQVSQAEKRAFALGVQSESSYKHYILNAFKLETYLHPFAAYAGSEAAYQNNQALINHMKP